MTTEATTQMTALKCRLRPTPEQEKFFLRSIEACRQAYNLAVRFSNDFHRMMIIDASAPEGDVFSAEDEYNGKTDSPIMKRDGSKLLAKPYKKGSYSIEKKGDTFYRKWNSDTYLTNKEVRCDWYALVNFFIDNGVGCKVPFSGNTEQTQIRMDFLKKQAEEVNQFRKEKNFVPFKELFDGVAVYYSYTCQFDLKKSLDSVYTGGQPQIKKYGERNSFTAGQFASDSTIKNRQSAIKDKYRFITDSDISENLGNAFPNTNIIIPAANRIEYGVSYNNGKRVMNSNGSRSTEGTLFLRNTASRPEFKDGVACFFSKKIRGAVRNVCVVQEKDGWYASIVFETTNRYPNLCGLDNIMDDTAKGVDFGIKKDESWDNRLMYTDCSGRTYKVRNLIPLQKKVDAKKSLRDILKNNPTPSKEDKDRIRQTEEALRKTEKRIVDIRKTDMRYAVKRVVYSDKTKFAVVAEDLDSKQLTATKSGSGKAQKAGLNRAILSVSPYMATLMLEAECRKAGRHFIKLPQQTVKSSQTCNCCGYVNKEVMNLSVRNWTCPNCNTNHDRDQNAALTNKKFGVKVLKGEKPTPKKKGKK